MAIGQGTRDQDGRGRAAEPGRTEESAERMRQKAAETGQDLQRAGKERLEQGKETAAHQVQQLADVVGETANRLSEQDHSLAGYASELASNMSRLANDLRHRSIDELIGQTQSIARRNPAMFLMGSIAVGLALSRFMKASAERERERQRSIYSDTPSADATAYQPPIGTATGDPVATPPDIPAGDLH